MRGLLARFKRESEGSVAVVAALCMVMFIGCLGLVLDAGVMYIQRTQLQKAVDSAALAAAYDLSANSANSGSSATSYANYNQVLSSELLASPKTGPLTVFDGPCASNGCAAYRVTAQRQVPLSFAPLVGFSQATVTTTATAVNSPAKAFDGADLLPYVVWDGNASHVYLGENVTYRGNGWVGANILPDPNHCGGNNQPACNPNWLGGGNTSNNFKGFLGGTIQGTVSQGSTISGGGNQSGTEPLDLICQLQNSIPPKPGIMPVVDLATGNNNSMFFHVKAFVAVRLDPIPSCTGSVTMATDFTGTLTSWDTSKAQVGGVAFPGEPTVYVLKLWY